MKSLLWHRPRKNGKLFIEKKLKIKKHVLKKFFPLPWSNKMNKWELFLTTSGPAKEKTHKDSLISRREAC